MVRVKTGNTPRLRQGDVIREVEYIESVSEMSGIIEVAKIVFPLAIVLTQDCDLAQDYKFRWSKQQVKNEDKWLLSVIMAPLYNLEHVYTGEHLQDLGMRMTPIGRKGTPASRLLQNETPRYHYLEFPASTPIAPSVVDFKHYFTANVASLKKHKPKNFVCQVSELYREDISQRFASYLSRIGLP